MRAYTCPQDMDTHAHAQVCACRPPTCTNVHVHGRVNVYCITLRHACVCTAASAEQAATAERDGAQVAAPADDGSLVA